MQFDQVKRRDFISALGGAAAWPIAAGAQQPARLPTIGFLGTTTASAWKSWTAAFVERLRELGWKEGSNVTVEYRWAEAHNERFAGIASEFVRLKADVIVTGGNAALAVKQTTSVISSLLSACGIAKIAKPTGSKLWKGPAESGQNLFGGSKKNSEKNSENSEKISVAMPTPCDPAQGCC
jgi:putative tryptophan/tyrosine transport system substrate-binding protein